jgi:REP element-mobilizing transposase RayT
MPNTYTQLYIQFVFAVKYRESLIQKNWKNELYKYITGVVQNNKSKMLAINGVADHIHLFIGYKPSVPIPDLIKDIKVASSLWVNEKNLVKVNLIGRRVTVLSLTDFVILMKYANTFKTRKFITRKKHSSKNTLNC